MTANELMIGNWIKTNSSKWSDEDLKDKYCKVEYIGENNLRCVLFDDSERHPYGLDSSFEPIPITPEILEKNGFEYDGCYCTLSNKSFDIVVYEYSEKQKLFRVRIDIRDENNAILPPHQTLVSYIHELQNFLNHSLRLYGMDKAIEL